MKLLKYLTISLLLLVASGCGGGGGSPGGIGVGASGSSAGVSATDFVFSLDKITLSASANDSAILTVTALDSNRNALKGVPVTVAVSDGGLFVPGTDTVTDVSGMYSGSVKIGSGIVGSSFTVIISVSGITKTSQLITIVL